MAQNRSRELTVNKGNYQLSNILISAVTFFHFAVDTSIGSSPHYFLYLWYGDLVCKGTRCAFYCVFVKGSHVGTPVLAKHCSNMTNSKVYGK